MSYNYPPSVGRTRRPVLGELQSAEHSAKRQRVLQPLYNTPGSEYVQDEQRGFEQDTSGAVLEHLAKHGGRMKEIEQQNAELANKLQEVSSDLESEVSRNRALQAELAFAKELNAQPNKVSQQLQAVLQQEKNRRVAAEDTAAKLTRTLEDKGKQILQLEEEVDAANKRFYSERKAKREEVAALQQRLEELQDSFRQQLSAAELSTAAAQRRMQHETTRADELESDLVREKARSRQLATRELDMDSAAAQLQAAACREQERQGRIDELSLLVEQLTEQLQGVQQQLHTARQTQGGGGSVAVLREELAVAQRQAAEGASLRGVHQELQLHCSRVEEEVATWRDCCRRVPNVGNAGELVAAYRALQAQVVEGGQRAEELQAQARALATEAAAARKGQEAAEKLLGERGREAGEAVGHLERARALVGVLTQERDTLQGLLDSYKVLPEEGEGGGGGAGGGAEVQQVVQRYKLLEVELQQSRRHQGQYKTQVQQLQADVEQLEREQQRLRAAERAAVEGREEVQAAHARLERELAMMGRELATLQGRVGQGAHDPSRSRVLQLKRNPLAAVKERGAQERTRHLEAENEVLRRQVEALGEADGGGGGVAAAEAEAEARVQRERAEDLEKQLKRTREVVKERLAAFREAVQQLFGFSIHMVSDARPIGAPGMAATTYSLHPMHHPDKDAALMFRYDRTSGWELLATPYAQEVQRDVETFIHKFRCIPAFTANITMQLFNSVTHVG